MSKPTKPDPTPANVAERGLEVQQIGNGVITTVSPAAKSFGN